MNIQETITNQIIEAIELGAGEFKMPWHKNGISSAMPHNPISKNTYSGANVLTLWLGKEKNGYATDQWATFKQWQSKGVMVKKGEKATLGFYWHIMDKAPKGEGEGESDPTGKKTMFAKAFYLFNADQVDGYQPEGIVETPDLTERLDNAENFIIKTGAIISHGGTSAFYRPSTDSITMPDKWRFTGTETTNATQAYYSTLLHELTHWSGNAIRLDRTKGKRFGDTDYAFEELVAELGAAFLCADLGIENEPRLDHAQYVASWLKALKNDKQAIFSAASYASKAMAYLKALDIQPIAIAA
jgi:antirestriction protein ArdC